ncbi:unnamed protein product [Protopolystoma xenopodis]|uniref:Uncharacterized protein n=1 Tax=Protopolystoma xenopodis TaxID=117903 RepID=A0A448XND1_9PLAT|nr:unnamed protein product [Protopolystoma xenopodis]
MPLLGDGWSCRGTVFCILMLNAILCPLGEAGVTISHPSARKPNHALPTIPVSATTAAVSNRSSSASLQPQVRAPSASGTASNSQLRRFQRQAIMGLSDPTNQIRSQHVLRGERASHGNPCCRRLRSRPTRVHVRILMGLQFHSASLRFSPRLKGSAASREQVYKLIKRKATEDSVLLESHVGAIKFLPYFTLLAACIYSSKIL